MADTPKEDPDQALLTAARRGDLDAFETLVKRHETVVYNLVRTLVGNRADVEDIAQEAFVRAYRFLKQFRGDSTFRTWLFRVVVNTTRSYQGRRTRQQKVWGDSGEGTAASLSERLPDPTSLEDTYLRRDVIARALATLPADMRESLVLRDVHGLDYHEIAVAMDVPLGTVESRIFRARQRLRPLLAELLGRRARTTVLIVRGMARSGDQE